MITPDKKITLLFQSARLDGFHWRVRMTMPPATDATGAFALEASDWEDRPIADGTFILHGQRHVISNGRGSVPASSFIAHINDTSVWYVPDGKDPEPGALTFG